ncbi:MAG TPA: protein kinase [Pyrinomonadaceae bacterium]|jgi:non-specific serine/threonine protein kinase/serine/threonine-protein kinase
MNGAKSDDNRWQRLKNVFNEAVELTPEMRSSYLSSLRLNEKTFYQELAELIEVDLEAEDFLGEPVKLEFDSPSLIGETVGHYRIEREIERGGMGVVFEAARFDGEFDQRVAVKLVNHNFFNDELVRRFKTERQILARLEHPNIVRLLDGGFTEYGTPYYVMEFVEGVPVNVYCRENNLDINEKLELFLQICSAVAYAHRQLIVHRDLKPSNILITKNGEAKLLDFGIAKILNADADAQTQTQNAPLTPAYASPEQIKGETIATASDVYSLGVILYELLTEKPPREIYSVSQMEIPHGICEIEPVAPSRAKSQLKGDLDNIILKAIQKEKERRYDSVEQFADDVKSYLNGLPVKAHPQSFRYRAAKFVKRNRLSAALAAAAILLIAGGVAAAIWQSFEARKQQQIAEQRFEQVRKIANSFIFDYHDEIARLDGSTSLRERLVSDGVNYLDAVAREEINNPELLKESAIAYRKIGDAQGKPYTANLGKSEDAIQSYRKSVALLERAMLLAPADLSLKDELVETSRLLANVESRVGNWEQAQQILQKALTLHKELLASDETNVERKIAFLSLQIALTDAGGGIEHCERALGEADALYASGLRNKNLINLIAKLHSRIGNVNSHRGKSEEKKGDFETARNWFAQALEHRERNLYYTELHPDAITEKRWIYSSYFNYAETLTRLGRTAKALKNLEIAVKILQDLKKNTDDRELAILEIWILGLKISIFKQQGKPEAALAEAERALNLALERTEADPANIEPISATLNLANEAAKLASELKRERQAESYRRICRKYEKPYKERFGADFSYVF